MANAMRDTATGRWAHGAAVIDRLLSRVSQPEGLSGCWIYTGYLSPDGYGEIGNEDGDGHTLTHRVAYSHFKGPIPDGLQIDHLCRNRSCCNPDHLEAVTRRENILRGESPFANNAKKTHCVNGHPLNEKNTYRRRDRETRECKQCRSDAVRRYQTKGDSRG